MITTFDPLFMRTSKVNSTVLYVLFFYRISLINRFSFLNVDVCCTFQDHNYALTFVISGIPANNNGKYKSEFLEIFLAPCVFNLKTSDRRKGNLKILRGKNTFIAKIRHSYLRRLEMKLGTREITENRQLLPLFDRKAIRGNAQTYSTY